MSNLRVSELDFDQIKSNLKQFLKNQTEFTDYDFEGSGLSVLLDVLAYNTHYNAYIANMLVNEMFLDSAVKRASAVSLAKSLGYVPKSATSAKAYVDITITDVVDAPSTYTLPQYTPFTTTINDESYTFLTTQTFTADRFENGFTFENIPISEGTVLRTLFTAVEPGPSEKYEIPNDNVDVSSIRVTVQNSITDTTTRVFSLKNDITGVSNDSLVFYLEENALERYEIFFGDGVLGKKLDAGNIITVEYLITNGSAANTSSIVPQTFTTPSLFSTGSQSITTALNSTGGSPKEPISSIKFNAPRVFSTANRAVTASDYESLIYSSYSDAESVSVWGGEENNPPVYGKVFISLKPFDGFSISPVTKTTILNDILRTKKVLAIQPEFVDPDFFYVSLNATVGYNPLFTTITENQLIENVRTTIRNYFRTDLQKFNRTFNKSKLISIILNSDVSIRNILFSIKLQKRFPIILNTVNSFIRENTIKFENSLVPGTFSSTYFYVDVAGTQTLVKFIDIPLIMPPDPNGIGTLRIVNSQNNSVVLDNVGTINYASGEVTIEAFTPTAIPQEIIDIRFFANVQEKSQNLRTQKNQILVIDNSTSIVAAGLSQGLIVTAITVTE